MSETTSKEIFATDTPLLHLFGTPARTKLLAVFVDEREFDLSITELSKQAGLARSTVYDHIDDLLAVNVIEETRETGRSTRYQLNEDSDIAQALYELDGLVLQRLLELDALE